MNRKLSKTLHGLKISYWNINGLYRRDEDYCKLEDPLFVNEISNIDIIGLSETHCSNDDVLHVDGYQIEKSVRPKPLRARKNSGGIAILIKE